MAIFAPGAMASSAPGTLSTAGISSARARMAEWLVAPPVSVMIPAMFSRLRPTVMLGVRSWATITVPAGAEARSWSSRPSRVLSSRSRRSATSVARWRVSSSSTALNMAMKLPHTASTAASATAPPSICSFIWPTMKGSANIMIWPERISAACSPTWLVMAWAMAASASLTDLAAAASRAFSCSAPAYCTLDQSSAWVCTTSAVPSPTPAHTPVPFSMKNLSFPCCVITRPGRCRSDARLPPGRPPHRGRCTALPPRCRI